jgi:hypothetical protein
MTFADCTPATALGAIGVETLMGTINLSSKAKRIIGVWATAIGKDTMTSTEVVSGIFRLQSDSVDMSPSKWPLDSVTALTSGAIALPTHIIPCDIPVTGLAAINCYVTCDDDTSGAALAGRVGVVYEG